MWWLIAATYSHFSWSASNSAEEVTVGRLTCGGIKTSTCSNFSEQCTDELQFLTVALGYSWTFNLWWYQSTLINYITAVFSFLQLHWVTVEFSFLQCIGWTFNLWLYQNCHMPAADSSTRSSSDNCSQSKLLQYVTVSFLIIWRFQSKLLHGTVLPLIRCIRIQFRRKNMNWKTNSVKIPKDREGFNNQNRPMKRRPLLAYNCSRIFVF